MPRSRVRIIYDTEDRFSDGLEARARALMPREQTWDGDPLRSIDRQIALVIEEIDRARAVHTEVLRSSLRNECEMRTELMQMEARTPTYSPYRFPEREKIRRSLLGLDQERRRLDVAHEQQMAELRRRLLDLLEGHGQVE